MGKWKKGEIAVLRNSIGGRLFKVDQAHDHIGLDGEIITRVTEAKQLPWHGRFDTSDRWLIKVKDKQAGERLVDYLTEIHNTFNNKRLDLNQKEQAAFEEVIDLFEIK
jgi:hypothetical protein